MKTEIAIFPIIELCPVCGKSDAVRLDPRWEQFVDDGAALPKIGCGNPWHYIDRKDKTMQPFDLGRSRA